MPETCRTVLRPPARSIEGGGDAAARASRVSGLAIGAWPWPFIGRSFQLGMMWKCKWKGGLPAHMAVPDEGAVAHVGRTH